jgi:hypothetical protein
VNNLISSIIVKFALAALHSVAHAIWEGIWSSVFDSIKSAEQQWQSSGHGKVKKDWVLDQIMTYIDKMKKFNGIQKWAIKIFMGKAIDAIVEELNKSIGQDWVKSADMIKVLLEKKIPFLS